MYLSTNTLTGIELMRLEQAKRLNTTVVESCLIVEGLVFYVAILFLFNDQFALSAAWLVCTSLMVFATFSYARLKAPNGVDETNYKSYLSGHIWVSTVTGIVWSAFAVVQLDADSLLSLFLAFTIATSITLGGMFPNSAYRATYIGLLSACVVPVAIWWVIVVPGPLKFFAAGLLVYFAFGLISSARTEINMRDLLLARQAESLNEKLKSENAIIEKTNAEKTRFMVATVHDFSQPLHAQGYFIHALRNVLTESKQFELLERIESSWRSQGELLQGIGDIVRFDGGLTKPNLMPVNLEKALENIASEFRSEAQNKNIDFQFDLTPIVLKTDPALLARIIRNLLSNAFKFTPNGGRIRLTNYELKGRVIIEVKDSGVGIPERDQQRIFEEYVQLGNETHDRHLGLGLGLSIVRRLVSSLHIDMTLDSTPGKGTTFTLSLPGYPKFAPMPEADVLADDSENAFLVVVVDDEQDIQDAMRALLESSGCEVITAAGGDEAVESLSETNRTPDLLVVDNRLSETELGLDLIVRMRDEVNHSVPALLMTGDVDSLADVDLGPEVTMMAKPVSPERLAAVIKALDPVS